MCVVSNKGSKIQDERFIFMGSRGNLTKTLLSIGTGSNKQADINNENFIQVFVTDFILINKSCEVLTKSCEKRETGQIANSIKERLKGVNP